MSILLEHWRESLIALLVAALLVIGVRWQSSLIAEGQAREKVRVADSTLKAIKPQLARVDTLLIRDTVRVARLIAKTDTLRDSLLVHLTDTVRVREYITRADSAAHACLELSNDCATFRRLALQRFAVDSVKLASQPAAAPRTCTTSNGVSVLIGAAVGYIAHRR